MLKKNLLVSVASVMAAFAVVVLFSGCSDDSSNKVSEAEKRLEKKVADFQMEFSEDRVETSTEIKVVQTKVTTLTKDVKAVKEDVAATGVKLTATDETVVALKQRLDDEKHARDLAAAKAEGAKEGSAKVAKLQKQLEARDREQAEKDKKAFEATLAELRATVAKLQDQVAADKNAALKDKLDAATKALEDFKRTSTAEPSNTTVIIQVPDTTVPATWIQPPDVVATAAEFNAALDVTFFDSSTRTWRRTCSGFEQTHQRNICPNQKLPHPECPPDSPVNGGPKDQVAPGYGGTGTPGTHSTGTPGTHSTGTHGGTSQSHHSGGMTGFLGGGLGVIALPFVEEVAHEGVPRVFRIVDSILDKVGILHQD